MKTSHFPTVKLKIKDEHISDVHTEILLGLRVEIKALTLLLIETVGKNDPERLTELMARYNDLVQEETNDMEAWLAPYCEIEAPLPPLVEGKEPTKE